MSIPSWIKHDDKGYFTNLEPCKCERCKIKWFPRVDKDGTLKLNICPDCKTKLWNVPKK
jgi:hypothetical protein